MNPLKLFPTLAANKSKKDLLNAAPNGFIDPEIFGKSRNPNVNYFGGDSNQQPVTVEPVQIGTEIQTRPLEKMPEAPAIPVAPTRDDIETENYLRERESTAPSISGKLYPATSGNTSDEIQSAINELGSTDMGREHSFKNRLLSGLWKGIQAWSANGGQGGLAGLAGATLTGGIGSAASPNFHGELRRNDLKNKLYGRLGEARKQEEFEANLDYKRAQAATIPIDDENKRLDIELKREIAGEKKRINERSFLLSQIRTMKRYKKGENPSFDSRIENAGIDQPDFEPDKKIKPRYWDGNGRLMTFDDNGATVPVLTPEGKETIDETRGTVNYNGFAVRPGTALNNKTQVEVSNVSAGNQTNNDLEIYKGKVADLNGRIAASSTRLQGIKTELSRIDGLTGIEKLKAADEKSKLQKELRDTEAELSGYQKNLKDLPKPAPTISRNAPVINGKYSGRTFASPTALRSAFPNKTDAEIRQIIEANGGQFQQ